MKAYTIKYIEQHVIMDNNSYYVWYENYYIYDFKRISDNVVIHIPTNTKNKLRKYFSISCTDLEYPLHGYSKSTLVRKTRRLLRKHNKCVRLQKQSNSI